MSFTEEAEKCRTQALSYLGKPEAPFLLSVARAFDQLESSKPAFMIAAKREAAPLDLPVAL